MNEIAAFHSHSSRPSNITPLRPKRFLWMVPKWPIPADDGARVATTTLIRNLTAQGEEVHLLAHCEADEQVSFDEARERLGITDAYIIRKARRKSKWILPLEVCASLIRQPRTPLTMRHFASGRARRMIQQLISGRVTAGIETSAQDRSRSHSWDALVYDGLHPAIHASHWGTFRRTHNNMQIIYRAHNHEAVLWERKAALTKSPLWRMLFRHQAGRVRAFEDSLIRSASWVAPVSAADFSSFKQTHRGLAGGVIPIGYEFGDIPAMPNTVPRQLLFLGRLDWPPNKEGLVWFLQKVWPRVADLRSDLTLLIAGSGDTNWLQPYLSQPRLQFVGRVADVEDLYRNSVLALVPIFYGSGTRVKVIEASRYGRPCLSTALGVEGIGLREGTSYLRGEDAESWIQQLSEFCPEDGARVGRAAYLTTRDLFDCRAVAQMFRIFAYSF